MNTPENFTDIKNDAIDIVKEVRYYTFFWPWFLACVFLMSITVFVYLRYSSNTYASTAIVQVKDANSDPSSFLTQTAGAMFNFNRVKIDNFITQITAKPNIKNVVKALDLQTNIYSVGRVKTTLSYGQDIPFEIDFKTDITLNEGIILKVQDEKTTLEYGNKDYTLTIGQTFELEDFRLTFNDLPENDSEFLIVRTSETAAMAALSQSLTVSSSSEEGDNIEIAFQGPNIKRNEAIINSLIETAHADQVNEKRQIYALSIDFINSRLSSIVNEIDSLSLKTTGFKSNNLIFSPEAQTSNALSSLTDLEQEKFNLTTQIELARSLQQNLQSQLNFSLLPSNIGINSGNVNELVVAYNTLVLERNGLLSGATERNPIIVQLSTQLTDLKKNILSSIDNYLENLETSLTKYKEFKNTTSAQVAKIPKLEATLLAFERKFQIAENLYLFLLQKREEASISYEATLPDTRVINHAYTNPAPVAPKRSRIFIGAILLGFLLPFGVLYILKITDSKIHTREDLEKSFSNLDILGEIPYMEDTSSLLDARGGFAESARIIRSNISYKLPEDGRCKVILATSSIKGEGKTLNAFNMANSYVCSGKKVLLIGADLRNPQIHNILGYNRKSTDKGLSSLLVDSALSPKAHISKVMGSFDGTLDILYSGPIPPNPAELLGSKAFTDLLDLLKNDYDYIFIDSAPLLLVSDSIPLIKYADLVLYTTRADYTDKKIAPFVLKLIKDKEIKNFGLVLNGIKTGARSYYQYGYSYRYSYAYQYNYGYGYGYGSDDK